MRIVESRPDVLVLGIPESMFEMARGSSVDIEELVKQVAGKRWPIAIVALREGRVLTEEERTTPEPAPSPAAESGGEPGAPPIFDRAQAENHPLIRAAVAMFGAKVVDVRPRRAPGQPG